MHFLETVPVPVPLLYNMIMSTDNKIIMTVIVMEARNNLQIVIA